MGARSRGERSSELRFGFSLDPTTDLDHHVEMVRVAEEEGLDLAGVQDHPYLAEHVDTLSLIALLASRTDRLRFFPDVANLPLRPPAMLAKASATLDLLSGGRFELGLGAGGYWSAISRMGIPELTGREATDALEEAIEILRFLWDPERRPVEYAGAHYGLGGVRAGPAPAHPIAIWLGAQGPRTMAMTGRLADGWAAPIPQYLPYERWEESNRRIDEAAAGAGRDPADVLRIAQLVGTVTDGAGEAGEADASEGSDPVRGSADQWGDLLARLASEHPFRAFVFWPEEETAEQVGRFARDVAPRVRERAEHP